MQISPLSRKYITKLKILTNNYTIILYSASRSANLSRGNRNEWDSTSQPRTAVAKTKPDNPVTTIAKIEHRKINNHFNKTTKLPKADQSVVIQYYHKNNSRSLNVQPMWQEIKQHILFEDMHLCSQSLYNTTTKCGTQSG